MNHIKKISLIIFSACILTGCKKESTPVFKATGYWKGFLHTFNTVLINRDNGACRIYLGVNLADTSVASYAFNGNYTVSGNVYQSKFYVDTTLVMVMETNTTAPLRMTGYSDLYQSTLPFELNKQP